MAAKLSLRDKHAAETRQRLLDEAMRLFVDQGYAATTIDEIAERADVSPRTFFRYFPTKEAVLFHDLEEQLTNIRGAIEARPADEAPAATLVHVLEDIVLALEQTPERRALMVQLISERPAMRTYQREVVLEHSEREVVAALAQRAGLPPDDLGVRAMVAAVNACFDIALRDWVAAGAGDGFGQIFLDTLAACRSTWPA